MFSHREGAQPDGVRALRGFGVGRAAVRCFWEHEFGFFTSGVAGGQPQAIKAGLTPQVLAPRHPAEAS